MSAPTSQPFSCQRAGLAVRGRVYGLNAAGSSQPAVILSHGFLANQHMCTAYAQLLATLGYAAFTFDFCGGGLRCTSEGRTQDMTILTEKADLLAVMDYVRQVPQVDADQVSLLGCSQGGLVSALVARERPDAVARLVLLYPALCIPDDARAGHMMFYRFDPSNVPDLLGRFPMPLGGNYARCVMDMDVFAQIGGYAGPVLYLQGDADKVVDVSYARRAHGLYPHCRYEEIAGGGHLFRGAAERQAQALLAEFMAR